VAGGSIGHLQQWAGQGDLKAEPVSHLGLLAILLLGNRGQEGRMGF